MAGLLSLPLELREPILVGVILDTTQQQPNDPAAAKCSEGYEFRKTIGFGTEPQGSIFCKPLRRHAMSLLHVNQQIRDEVIDIMPRRLAQRVDDAKLDLLYVQYTGWDLWATWLSAPFPTNNLNTVQAQIRNFQVRRSLSERIIHPTVSIGEDCNHWVYPEFASMLLNFLADSLQTRPGKNSIYATQKTAGAHGSKADNLTIQNLVINIPFELDPPDSLETRVRCSQCTDADGDIVNNHLHHRVPSGRRSALILAQSLRKQMLHFFETAPTGWRAKTFPKIVFECIGTIHLKVQGKLFGSLDLSQILAGLPHSEEWNNISRAEFFQWKRAAEEERMTAGFTLVKPSVQEHELVGSAGIIASMLSARGESLVREVTTSSEDVAPSGRQPAANGAFAFSGKAIFVQEDGSALPGNATFYQDTDMGPWLDAFWLGGFSRIVHPVDYRREKKFQEEYIEERSKDGELILFTGEVILFWADNIEGTIISGEATFYCQGEEGSME
ncbi:hypothetical protein SLS63_010740 [Diaporthe eres]|uniref:Uncharacterized protein n=1 Tax=Diaporthe eres TaxID=83184 RepID=A0ABR1NW42_DIAER